MIIYRLPLNALQKGLYNLINGFDNLIYKT